MAAMVRACRRRLLPPLRPVGIDAGGNAGAPAGGASGGRRPAARRAHGGHSHLGRIREPPGAHHQAVAIGVLIGASRSAPIIGRNGAKCSAFAPYSRALLLRERIAEAARIVAGLERGACRSGCCRRH